MCGTQVGLHSSKFVIQISKQKIYVLHFKACNTMSFLSIMCHLFRNFIFSVHIILRFT